MKWYLHFYTQFNKTTELYCLTEEMRIISFNYIEHDICKQRSQNAENSPPDTEKCRLNRVQTAFF
ncbi:hypothetical protein COH63_03030 [Neisseria meningitidis]|nr:hypothetical protein COH93_02930 [Neisseria meningitidis]RQK58879.1 hypothetical protein COH63_03030 [Neisseria meningitidis]